MEQVEQLLALRRGIHLNSRPLILWEPRPSSCLSTNLNAVFKAVRTVDVFSPNHLELLATFGRDVPDCFVEQTFTELALPVLTSGIGPTKRGIVVIRAAEHGCFIASSEDDQTWLPPFYEEGNVRVNDKVVDPTGAGNAFLGAFAIGLLATRSMYEAACYGSVAASFALEQIGLPELENAEGEELWNGDSVQKRLMEYKSRLERCRDGKR